MNLDTAFVDMRSHYRLPSVDSLLAYANEDAVGGYHMDAAQAKWPVGSLWQVEGQVLYALVRALKPKRILELGRRYGCSTTHIAQALAANGAGRVVSIDNNVHGDTELLIPEKLYPFIEIVNGDAFEYLNTHQDKFDLIFEDLDHDRKSTAIIARDAKNTRLNANGVLVVHDTMHFLVGEAIRAGLQDADIPAAHYLIEPSDCGLGIWQKPGEWKPVESELVSKSAAPKKAAARKPKAKK